MKSITRQRLNHFNNFAKTSEPIIENIIGYKFKNSNLLRQAFMHSSLRSSNGFGGKDNEELEFYVNHTIPFTAITEIHILQFSK